MGAHGSGSGAEVGLRPLSEPVGRPLKPPPDRLYGRQSGHKLRSRQVRLIEQTLPRLRFLPCQAADPHGAFVGESPELWIEVGFGGGEHALAQIAAHPRAGLIACEVFEAGLCSLLSRLVPDGDEADARLPANLRIWDDDARRLLALLPDACVDRLFLLFPDPWPKARHAKRRFVHPATLASVARVLREGAEWRIATDDPTYQRWVVDVFATQALFRAGAPADARPDGWPATRYEEKAIAAGRRPMYWSVRRTGATVPGPGLTPDAM